MVLSSEQQNYGESDHCDEYDSDDSQTDPTFDILEETRSSFSRLSTKKKSKTRIDKEIIDDGEGEGGLDVIEVVVPELDEKDQKSYEAIQKVIEAGRLEKLKVDQCKVYLRKHGLRLTGNKDTLIQRITEHVDVLNGGGEKKYPASSFIVNCKGDACTGDIVLFEQNVYEMFNIASRSANGPPCGSRVIAGRIVKESYGAAKQQHTFTIEVLWSKGEKPFAPLHPLLIKGRNLYRLKTLRQKWEDEGERKMILSEKHARGSVARSNREARVQEREIRKMLKSNRVLKREDTSRKQEEKREQILPSSLSIPLKNLPRLEDMQNTEESQNCEQKECWELRNCEDRTSARPEGPELVQMSPKIFLHESMPLGRHHLPRQPFTNMNCNIPRNTCEDQTKFKNSMSSVHGVPNNERHANRTTVGSHLRAPGGCPISNTNPLGPSTGSHARVESNRSLQKHSYRGNLHFNPLRNPKQMHSHLWGENFNASRNLVREHLHEKKQQPCRYYAQGRCYSEDNCRYLHEKKQQPCRYYAQGRCCYGDNCRYLHEG